MSIFLLLPAHHSPSHLLIIAQALLLGELLRLLSWLRSSKIGIRCEKPPSTHRKNRMIDKEDIYRYIFVQFVQWVIYIYIYVFMVIYIYIYIYMFMNIHEYLISPYMMIDINSPYFLFSEYS